MSTTIESRAAQPTVYVRTTVPVSELTGAQGQALGALHTFLSERTMRPAGPPYVRYHTFGDTSTDVEVGVPIDTATEGAGQVVTGELPGGPVAYLVHIGSHGGLGQAYERLASTVNEAGREAAGPAWEVYHWIDLTAAPDPATWPAPDQWRTDLVQPVR